MWKRKTFRTWLRPDVKCPFHVTAYLTSAAASVWALAWEMEQELCDGWQVSRASAVKWLQICLGKTHQEDTVTRWTEAWGRLKEKQDGCRHLFPKQATAGFLSGNPSPLPKGPFMSYIHKWQEPASPCAGGTQMKKHGRERAGSGYWTWKWHFHFPLILNYIADF